MVNPSGAENSRLESAPHKEASERLYEETPSSVLEAVSGIQEEPLLRSRYFRQVWAVLGMMSFMLGALGAILPLIPTTPFLLFAAFCFARSSQKLEQWFHSTRLYKTVLEGYVLRRSLSIKAKLMMLVPLTVLLGISFVLMSAVPVGRIVVACIWVAHLVYFGFVVKTERPRKATSIACAAVAPQAAPGVSEREGV